MDAKKRLTTITYGSHKIHLIRIENKISALLEASPALAQEPSVRSLFVGNIVGGVRFSPDAQPVRSKLGVPAISGEGYDLLE